MAMKPFDKEEQAFLEAVGLLPDELELLVEGAPPVAEEVQARIGALTRQKLGLDALPTAASGMATPQLQTARQTRHWAMRWLPAAAAAVLATSALLVASNPSAQAALQRLLHLVPGFGITETDRETLVLAAPVTVKGDRGELTVSALVGTSGSTELLFRVDGLTIVKPDTETMDRQPVQATLILPDNTRLSLTGAQLGAGLDNVRGTLWFPAIPADVRTVTLELLGMHGLTDPFTTTIGLVDVASAGLTQPVAGGWSQQHEGIQLGAPYVALAQDRITLSLEAILAEEGARIAQFGDQNNPPVLTDNLGNRYPLAPEEGARSWHSGHEFSATFVGPVHEGATALYLTINAVEVEAPGVARLRVPLSQLPIGQATPLQKTVKLGARSIVVRSVTRLSADQFDLDLDLGPDQSSTVLQYLSVLPYRQSGGSGFRLDPANGRQATDFEVSYQPQSKYLDLQFSRPKLHVIGPWQIELPVHP